MHSFENPELRSSTLGLPVQVNDCSILNHFKIRTKLLADLEHLFLIVFFRADIVATDIMTAK